MSIPRPLWTLIKRELRIWQLGALPGVAVISLIVLLRFLGGLQLFEWIALDYMLRSRPAEPIDPHILIVGIDEDDIQAVQEYPIPDGTLAKLIQVLKQANPAVIGLDIFRDLSQGQGQTQLENLFRNTPNLIGIEKVLPRVIAPPPILPETQVGFADVLLDADGKLRRSLLGTYNADETEFHYSLAVRLAEQFLSQHNLSLEAGIHDPFAFRFGVAELPRIRSNTGGYRNLDNEEVETLIHYRSGAQPFEIVSMQAVLTGEVPASLIRDRIVLVGVVAPSVKDSVNSTATVSIAGNPTTGIVYGVEIQAHAVSQIVQAALYNRPLLHSWAEGWEYVWIITWGIVGISLGRFLMKPWRILAALGMACLVLLGLCYGLLLLGWWIPLVPSLLVLFLNSAGLTAALFYRYQQDLKRQLRDRQYVIEYTFDALHNGPLQTLSLLLKKSESGELDVSQFSEKLGILNQELREVYESVRREISPSDTSLCLKGEQEVNLNSPFHEVLYEVYSCTMERDFECFKTIKFCVTTFNVIDTIGLTLEQKRGLCRFLEEALCNVGKYAVGVTRLDVTCTQEQGWNIIHVIDNGKGLNVHAPKHTNGRGTHLSIELARQLRGQFRREAATPQGTCCELKWSATKSKFWD